MEYHHPFEVLDTFMNSFVHGKDWPKQVFAIVLYDGQFEFVAKNSPSHTEDKVLDYFKQSLMNYSLPKIKLFLSASPCGMCSEKIINFVSKTGLSLEIVFAGLYNIRRPSCVRNPDCHCLIPSEHNFNVDGLKKLYSTQGVCLRPFTGQNWVNLKVAMGVHPNTYDCSIRQNEDFELWRDFEEIMEIRPSSFFPKPAFPMEPSRLVTARDSSVYESQPAFHGQLSRPCQLPKVGFMQA